jgi:hypothetical protein
VYLVSDMGQDQNTQLMLAIAPQVKDVLRRIKG